METKIIKVVFGGRKYTTTEKRTRTDYGQMLEFVDIDLPDSFEVIFSNSDTSAGTGKKMIGSNQRVLIPDEYLKTGQPIYAWILVHDGEDDGRHMYSIKSPVDDMPETSPEEPTPVEQSVISQAITALNSAVTTTSQKAQEASDSADRAEHAAEDVEGYAERAEAAQSASESARDLALESKVSAQASAATATEKADSILNLTASAQTLPEGSSASASYDAQTGVMTFGIPKGDKGDKGDRGEQGIQGIQGERGLTGAKGDKGDKGDTGAQGIQGEQGIQGIQGEKGDKGDKGDTGEVTTEEFLKAFVTDSASGSIASFPDGADDIPLKSCIVQVEPVQEGSGDPSPENVRPISGWTGVEVQHSGEDTLSPTTYPITFPSEAGTVYGAYVDVINGELVVDRAIKTITWGEMELREETETSVTKRVKLDSISVVGSYGKHISNIAPYNTQSVLPRFTTTKSGYANFMFGSNATPSDTDIIQVCYELAEPIRYSLTPQEIKTLLGQNNLWADTGDTEVEYRADTKLYIEKLTQPEEYDMIADSAINSGQFFMIGNSLYRALANIASGATITVGTNAQRVSLSDALNIVNA